ncbi:non-hydrolyzing UDP-N-acetylglucosamine 2-epimerase [Leucobacter komagatae]|uniref:UDP-N-acetylglucosamine 2-epimerase n=1 Tax=Leucobacter komagatae TaxID=55969 RepID=A0A0D0H3W0_9MICO|nr:UDP-N-acetylglucosamine 2-epimerase (non-hydrolyzing) [Leucobacter komagatae]KIP51860.1 UDP-N-acetylglucosamine 2-epimerase [Leucobacter komagatae]
MKIMSVVGARPQFVKLAPIAEAIAAAGHEHIIVHTGQHYDPMLSDVFFRDLGIPAPDAHLGVGSGTHGVQTGSILAQMDEVLERFSPDCVLVYGDTNSTLAAAVSAVKLHFPVAHLEAGLRSFNREMPEEHNRVLTDHAADLCLAPTEVAMAHLAQEGLAERAVLVGDVMTDVLYQVRDRVLASGGANPLGGEFQPGEFYVATIHRAENTNDPERLSEVVSALAQADKPVVLLAHPRVRAKADEHGISLEAGALTTRDPLAYPELIAAVLASSGVITDSGGLQKEAFLLRVPCTTVRHETEWVETVALGWNVLANTPEEITAAITRPTPGPTDATPYGTGHAAGAAVAAISARIA